MTSDGNPKTAYGDRKPGLDKIPPSAIIHLGVVMGLGARKYGSFNWRTDAVSSSVYMAAAMRHLLSWWDGETIDPESGAPHLAHVMACCAILLDADAVGKLNDNRPSAGLAADLIAGYSK